MKCPHCGSSDVYVSRKHVASLSWLFKMIRCHRCRFLFQAMRWASVPRQAEEFDSSVDVPVRRAA